MPFEELSTIKYVLRCFQASICLSYHMGFWSIRHICTVQFAGFDFIVLLYKLKGTIYRSLNFKGVLRDISSFHPIF